MLPLWLSRGSGNIWKKIYFFFLITITALTAARSGSADIATPVVGLLSEALGALLVVLSELTGSLFVVSELVGSPLVVSEAAGVLVEAEGAEGVVSAGVDGVDVVPPVFPPVEPLVLPPVVSSAALGLSDRTYVLKCVALNTIYFTPAIVSVSASTFSALPLSLI